MRITDVSFAALRVQYQLVRLPLRVLEEKVFARLDQGAPARLAYERSLGVLDATVGGVLRDPKTKNRLLDSSTNARWGCLTQPSATRWGTRGWSGVVLLWPNAATR